MIGTADAVAATVSDGFDAGSGTFYSGSGATQDCTIWHTGACSVKIDPVGTDEPHFSYARSTVNLPMEGATTVSFYFRADTTWGDVDSNAIVYFDTGQHVLLHTTEGFNNQVSLLSQVVPNRIVLGSWNRVRRRQGHRDRDRGGRHRDDGDPRRRDVDRGVEFWGYRWSWTGTPVRYDTLTVTNTPAVVNTGPRTTL